MTINNFQKKRLTDVKRCQSYVDELTQLVKINGRLSQNQIDAVASILVGLKSCVHTRLGKNERSLARAAHELVKLGSRKSYVLEMTKEEVAAWANVTGLWKVLAEQMRPINRNAIREITKYKD